MEDLEIVPNISKEDSTIYNQDYMPLRLSQHLNHRYYLGLSSIMKLLQNKVHISIEKSWVGSTPKN
jgi:hypothetical protein